MKIDCDLAEEKATDILIFFRLLIRIFQKFEIFFGKFGCKTNEKSFRLQIGCKLDKILLCNRFFRC